jgi:hypothetical protein
VVICPAGRLRLGLWRTGGKLPTFSAPEYWQYIDWPVAQTWRKALIEASGTTPRNFEN